MYMRKIILIDMDETLGTFTEISVFLGALTDLCQGLDYTTEFFKAMEVFTCFQRPRIIDLLKYMVNLRKMNTISDIVLYTNNQGSNEWVKLIAYFFDTKVGSRVFDDIIFSYIIGNTINDSRRTTQDKVLPDVRRALNINSPTRFLFIDDQLHNGMLSQDVTYLRIEPYIYHMNFSHMAKLYHDTYIIDGINIEEFVTSMIFLMSRRRYSVWDNNRSHDKYLRLSNKIMEQIVSFSRN